jgi:SAM-dependent methyltransferase
MKDSLNEGEKGDKEKFVNFSKNFPVSEALWRFIELNKLYKMDLKVETPILDLGCGNGQFSYALFHKIKAGVDLNAELLKAAGNLNFYDILLAADARELPFPSNSFKTVLCNCTLEHISNPEKCIAEVSRVLEKKGKFIVTVPSEFFNELLLFRSQWYVNRKNKQLAHINIFTLETWENLLGRSGFDTIQTSLYASPGFVKIWDCLDTGYRTAIPYAVFFWDMLLKSRIVLSVLYRKFLDEGNNLLESQKKKGGGRLFIAEKR